MSLDDAPASQEETSVFDGIAALRKPDETIADFTWRLISGAIWTAGNCAICDLEQYCPAHRPAHPTSVQPQTETFQLSRSWKGIPALLEAVERLLDSPDRHKIDPALRVEIEEAWNRVT